MARASPFKHADLEKRHRIVVDAATGPFTSGGFESLAKLGHISVDQRLACIAEINDEFGFWQVLKLADAQEAPARQLAALKPLNPIARELLVRLSDLPSALRQELRAPGLEGQIEQLVGRLDVLSKRLGKGAKSRRRPYSQFRLELFQDIDRLGAKFSPDHLAKNEIARRHWTATVMRALGVSVPDEKKNRALVAGVTTSDRDQRRIDVGDQLSVLERQRSKRSRKRKKASGAARRLSGVKF